MATVKPLVNYSGTIKEIQSGDSLSGVGYAPILSVKTSDQSVTSSTTLVDCTGLSFAIGANETWKMQMDFHATALGTAGMKWKFTVPSGCTGNGNGTASRNANGFQAVNINLTTGGSGTTVMGGQDIYGITGYFVNSSTAGTVQFQFAQGASNATATIILAYSCITAHRIS